MTTFDRWYAIPLLMGAAACSSNTTVGIGLEVRDEDGAPQAANFSCLGKGSAPALGATSTVSLPLVAFAELDAEDEPLQVPGMTVQIFGGEAIPDDLVCEADMCREALDLGDGRYELAVPDTGWFSYRVLERDAGDQAPAWLRSLEVDSVNPNQTENVRLSTISQPMAEALFALRELEWSESSSLVVGSIVDCDFRPVRNAVLSVFDGEGRRLGPDEKLGIVYFDDEGIRPSKDRGGTSWQGRFVLVNVPVDRGALKIEVSGALVNEGAISLIGCERVPPVAGGMSYRSLGPLRRDAPELCP